MSLKSLLYLNKFGIKCFLNICYFIFIINYLFSYSLYSQGIANYISNGGFEQYWNCSMPNNFTLVKYWRTIDSTNNGTLYFSNCPAINNIPSNGFTYQNPKQGNAYVGFTGFCLNGSCNQTFNRNYLRNRLKSLLQSNKIYCVKFYYNIGDNSTYGIDGLGAYFGNNFTLDTITKSNIPLTYLLPQVQNSNNNLLTDTLNWHLFTGTFVATGNESNLIIGNFKSNSATNSVLINPTFLPIIECDFLIDAVSCIPIDLPAYAGPDVFCVPGNSVYIGRPSDVGIDEACTWYKMPNMATPIATVAGLWVSPVANSTYVVKQDICGYLKQDTVVVMMSGVGISEASLIKDHLSIYPIPAKDELNLSFDVDASDVFDHLSVYNSIGQLIREEELKFINHKAIIKISDLSNGVYLLKLKGKNNFEVGKRFVIAK